MTELTRIINSLATGNADSAAALVARVYSELHQMALFKLRNERIPGALQATELVHEVYLRICGNVSEQELDSTIVPQQSAQPQWANRAHFFAAAAEAMRRILIEAARRRDAQKRGGDFRQAELDLQQFALQTSAEELIVVDDLLEKLQAVDAAAAQLVKLRVFAGFKMAEIAEILEVSPRTANDIWSYAKAWLRNQMQSG